MTQPTTEHPEKIQPTLPVHAVAPAVEAGEPVSQAMIAEAAYYRAEKRSFAGPGTRRLARGREEIEALTRAAL
jgi:hypothetical protein